MESKATYLGDGLYATYHDAGGIIELYAHNGYEKTNVVFLNPAILRAFEQYVAKLRSTLEAG